MAKRKSADPLYIKRFRKVQRAMGGVDRAIVELQALLETLDQRDDFTLKRRDAKAVEDWARSVRNDLRDIVWDYVPATTNGV